MGADVIVIGAGYGGLTTAAILAHNGVEVEVLEATGHPGGRAAFDRKDGFLVDYGIHVCRYAHEGAAASALREIGHEIDFASMGELQLWRGGSFINLPTEVPQYLTANFLSVGDKAVLIGNLLRLVLASSQKKADVPLDQSMWGKDRLEVPPLFKLLAGLGLIAPDITVTSAGEFSRFLRKAIRSKEPSAYPRGGTSQIIEKLSSKIEETGRISLNSRVRAIDIRGGEFASVNVKEDRIDGKAVVVAVPLQKLPQLAGNGISESLAAKCASIIPTAGISIDLCLTDKISDIDGMIVTSNPFTLGQFTSNIDPTTAPEGKQLATWYYPLPADVMDDRETVEFEEKRLLALLGEMFPGIMEKVEWERILRLGMVDGFEPRVGQTAKDRPSVRVPGIDNMFLAGDVAAAPGNGGDVAFASAIEAAHAVLSYLK